MGCGSQPQHESLPDTGTADESRAEDARSTKRRKVTFDVGLDCTKASEVLKSTGLDLGKIINLCQTSNMCMLLKNHQVTHTQNMNSVSCLGYLESSDQYRHLIHLAQSHPKLSSHPPSTLEIFSLPKLMSRVQEEGTAVVDQLKLAHKAATAVLQYHSTPWLAREWHLKDLALFGPSVGITDECLDTIHLSAEIPAFQLVDNCGFPVFRRTCNGEFQAFKPGDNGNDFPMTNTYRDSAPPNMLETLYGINNMTLFSLGVVLLQLGHWKPIEELRKENDHNDIVTTRRLAEGRKPLGARYQNVVRKCLQCDFGFGTDMSQPELQNAVYNQVIYELEEMIKGLSL